MSTKINPEFYGGENTFVTLSSSQYVKRCATNIGGLLSGDIYTGGSFDTSASPWGIGESSVSSDFFFIATKGAEWSIVDYNNSRKNTPIWFYFNTSNIEGGNDPSDLEGSSASSWFYSRAMYKNRMSPDVTVYNTEIHSTLPIDNTERIDLPNSVGQYPITYADYQNIRLVIGDVWVKQEDSNSITRTSMSAIQSGTVTVDKLIRFNFNLYDTSGNNARVQLSVGGSELDIPETFKTCYYNDKDKWVRPWHRISSVGYWYSSPYDQSVGFSVFGTDTGVAYTTSWETLSADDNALGRPNSNAWGHMSSKQQVFDDVSYHWKWGICHYNSDQFAISEIKNGDTFTSETLRNFAYMEFDNEPTNKNVACFNAILHEVAFLGFPIVIDIADVGEPIGSNKVYLPEFDEHVVTTGNFISGISALTLPNATWHDIFGVDMPVYDPEYEPETPVIPDYDTGDIPNVGLRTRRFGSHLNVWCLYQNQIDTIITAINDVYQSSADPVTQWQTDFQGANPSDYIVGFYAILTDPPKGATPQTFTLGVIDFDGDISAYRYDFTAENAGYFSFGDVDVRGYGNFLDYAPYTQLELYIPLCGTVELDTAYFMNHKVAVDMYYDVYTMSCVAAISRISDKGKTLYKTVNGNIGAQIPILSKNMGDYQNTIHSLESAHKQNENRLMTSMLTAGAGAAIAIGTGGAFLPAVAGVGLSGAGMINAIEQQKQIDYQLEHTQPTIAQTGVAESQNAFCVGQLKPKLNIKRAAILPHSDSIYSATVGNACCINDIVGNMSGLIVCSNINCDGISKTINGSVIAPTADEVAAIKAAFNNGVVV